MSIEDASFFLRKRYLVTFLAFVGNILIFILRTNLSIAIVEMTSEKHFMHQNETFVKKAEFDWDLKTQGFVLSVFSIGYLFGPLGGTLGLKYGPATMFGSGLAATAFFTVLSPIFLRLHFYLFIFARILEGVFESFSMASVCHIFVYWAPPRERSRLMVCCLSGALIGTALNYLVSGYIAYEYGWEAVFYITGGAVFVWYAFWLICASDHPVNDRWMTRKERDYFKSFSCVSKKDEASIPWKRLLTSLPFWAYVNEFFSYSWSFSFIMYCLPLYVKDAFAVDVKNNGLISSIPMVCGFFGMVGTSFLSDYLRNLGTISKSLIHRVFIATSHFSFVILIVYIVIRGNITESIICFSLAKLVQEISSSTYHVLVIDMFHHYTGLAKGFATTGASIAYFLNPIVMGFMVSDHSLSSWHLYFLFLCAFNIWSFVIYYFYGSGELQEWAAPKTNECSDHVEDS